MKPAKSFLLYCFALLFAFASPNALAFSLFGSFNDTQEWKEQVLLHDGSTIIVDRWQERGGNHEIGQGLPIEKQKISFVIPGTNQKVIWEDDVTPDVGTVSFKPLMLDILNNVPYLAVTLPGCIEYNKWGRPNPNYLFFKYVAGAWKQISLAEFPKEFADKSNLVTAPVGRNLEAALAADKDNHFVPTGEISLINQSQPLTERTIVRNPVPSGGMGGCPKLIPDGHTGWMGIGFFNKSYEQCKRTCFAHDMSDQYCPCKKLYPGQH